MEQMLLLGITDYCRCVRGAWKHLKRLEVFLVLPSGGGGSAGGKEGSAWFGHTRWRLHVNKGPMFIFYDGLEHGLIEVGKADIGGC